MTVHPTICLALLAALTLVGCDPAAEEESHLEHVIPAHKPGNFVEAVDQVDRRWTRLAESGTDARAESELADIIRWLPELAADSDLRKPQWDAVQRLSRELESLLSGPADDRQGARQQIDELLAISTIAAALPAPGQSPEQPPALTTAKLPLAPESSTTVSPLPSPLTP